MTFQKFEIVIKIMGCDTCKHAPFFTQVEIHTWTLDNTVKRKTNLSAQPEQGCELDFS